MCDQKLNIEFVEEVEKHEVLYNYKLSGYSRKDVTEKAWEEVAAKVNISAAECKKKWRNLRTVFARKIKPSGSGPNKKAYYLSEAMQFCLPFIKGFAPPSSVNFPLIPKYEMIDDDMCDDSTSQGDLSDIRQPSEASPTQSSANSPVPSEETVLPNHLMQASFTRPKKSRSNKSAEDADLCVAEYFKAKKAKLETAAATSSDNIDKKEALKMFLLSLLPELEELSDYQIKVFKRRVLGLIDDISTPLYPQYSAGDYDGQ